VKPRTEEKLLGREGTFATLYHPVKVGMLQYLSEYKRLFQNQNMEKRKEGRTVQKRARLPYEARMFEESI